jgi:hypothetical protein
MTRDELIQAVIEGGRKRISRTRDEIMQYIESAGLLITKGRIAGTGACDITWPKSEREGDCGSCGKPRSDHHGAGDSVWVEYVWTECDNCGGTGDYPSSRTPAGRCRKYCWQNRTPETYGKHSTRLDKFIKRLQRADRRAVNNRREWDANEAKREAAKAARQDRVEDPDSRIAALAEAFEINMQRLANDRVLEEQAHVDTHGGFTACDLIGKYIGRGELTDAQWEFVESLTEQQRERQAEREAAKPAPDGRVTVEGVVLKEETRHNRYGSRHVMTVKSDDGWVCWGSVPSDIYFVRKGARIRFDATIEPSDDDPKFGFLKRPTKAEVVEPAPAEAEA